MPTATASRFLSRFRAAPLGRLAAAAALGAAVAFAPVTSALAQARLPIVRDAEIETLVRDYAQPIFRAAGIEKAGIDIVLVNDASFNAFVAGRRMFINTGALMEAATPNEIIGVIAHEAGHIAGGHQDKLREQLARMQTMAVVASLLGIGATVAGAATKNSGMARAGGGIAMAGNEAAIRALLSYKRDEEYAADRSAITYLERTGQSAAGMLTTFARFDNAMSLTGTQIDPYRISHPMPRDRIANLETLARASSHFARTDPPALQQRHDMARAKIAAYTKGAAAVSRLFARNPRSPAALYGSAIATYLYGNLREALTRADALARSQPRNPYFQELRGDILVKANRPKEAAEAYRKAVALDASRSALLQVGYGQALLSIGTPDAMKQAVAALQKALGRDRENAMGYRFLAQAYGGLGQVPEAELATAEGHYYGGNYDQARVFAARAQLKMPRGSPGWVRAQDIINFRAPKRR